MGKGDLISGIFWLIFSVFICLGSYRLGLGSLHKPGPGFLFFWTGISLGIMSLIVFIRAWKGRKSVASKGSIFGKLNFTKLILVLVSIFLYALFMERLGFIPITFLFFIFILRLVEKKGWLFTLLVTCIVTASSYLLFETWLKSQLPAGLFEFLRF